MLVKDNPCRCRTRLSAIVIVVLLAIGGASCKDKAGEPEAEVDTREKQIETTLQHFAAFEKRVWGELLAKLEKEGTPAAIEVCRGVAVGLDKEFASLPGVRVRRVGTRLRNPAHRPDEWEQKVLDDWHRLMGQRLPLDTVAEDTPGGLRIMKPIVIHKRVCLRCHGAINEILPATRARIKEAYPNDKAVDYEFGDLRGAFSAIWPKQ